MTHYIICPIYNCCHPELPWRALGINLLLHWFGISLWYYQYMCNVFKFTHVSGHPRNHTLRFHNWYKCCHLTHDMYWYVTIDGSTGMINIIGQNLNKRIFNVTSEINILDSCCICRVFWGFCVRRTTSKSRSRCPYLCSNCMMRRPTCSGGINERGHVDWIMVWPMDVVLNVQFPLFMF